MESIQVCVRLRPRVNSQNHDDSLLKIEGNNIISGKTKEIFSFGKKFKKLGKFVIVYFNFLFLTYIIFNPTYL